LKKKMSDDSFISGFLFPEVFLIKTRCCRCVADRRHDPLPPEIIAIMTGGFTVHFSYASLAGLSLDGNLWMAASWAPFEGLENVLGKQLKWFRHQAGSKRVNLIEEVCECQAM